MSGSLPVRRRARLTMKNGRSGLICQFRRCILQQTEQPAIWLARCAMAADKSAHCEETGWFVSIGNAATTFLSLPQFLATAA